MSQEPPFRKGQRIRLIDMPNDPCPIPAGTTGTVMADSTHIVGDRWQTMIKWDIVRSLALATPEDTVEIIGQAPSGGFSLMEENMRAERGENVRRRMLRRD